MNSIEIFILKNKITPPAVEEFNTNDTFYVPASNIEKQISENNISGSVSCCDIENIPRSTKSSIIAFIDESSLIPSNYLVRIFALKAIHPKAASFFGGRVARINRTQSELLSVYQRILNRNEYSTCEISYSINKNEMMYPSLDGLVVSDLCYNTIGGYTSKDNITYNHNFFKAIDNYGDFIYHKSLTTFIDINNNIKDSDIYTAIQNFGKQCRMKKLSKELMLNIIRGNVDDNSIGWNFHYGWYTS